MKKALSILKSLSLLFALCFSSNAYAWTVYLVQPNDWDTPNIWAWKEGSNLTGNNWPGNEMSPVENTTNLYSYTGSGTKPTNLIFSNNGGNQFTIDNPSFNGEVYTYQYKKVKIYNTLDNYYENTPKSLYLVGDHSNWEFQDEYKFTRNGNHYSLTIPYGNKISGEWKIGTDDWNDGCDFGYEQVQNKIGEISTYGNFTVYTNNNNVKFSKNGGLQPGDKIEFDFNWGDESIQLNIKEVTYKLSGYLDNGSDYYYVQKNFPLTKNNEGHWVSDIITVTNFNRPIGIQKFIDDVEDGDWYSLELNYDPLSWFYKDNGVLNFMGDGSSDNLYKFTFDPSEMKLYATHNIIDCPDDVYLVGTGTGWECKDAYKFTKENNVYTLTLPADSSFSEWKIWNGEMKGDNWDLNYGSDGIKDYGNNQLIYFNGADCKAHLYGGDTLIFTFIEGSDSQDGFSKIDVIEGPLDPARYVYFVDTNDWTSKTVSNYTRTNLSAYQYSVGIDGGYNDNWCGNEMTYTEELKSLLDDAYINCKVYKAPIKKRNDKTVNRIIFNKESKYQTRNLVVVDGGVYFPNDNLYPSNIVRIKEDNTVLEVYPDDYEDNYPGYYTVYLDDSYFENFSKDHVGNDENKRICFKLTVNEEEKTGQVGTVTMMYDLIGDKSLYRIDIPTDWVKEGDEVDIEFYEALRHYDDINPNEEYPGHNWSANQNGYYVCQNSGDKGKIKIKDAIFKDGTVYYRNGETKNIREITTPHSLYLNNVEGTTVINDSPITKPYKFSESENAAGKLTYYIRNVKKGSKFNLLAKYNILKEINHNDSIFELVDCIYSDKVNRELRTGNRYDYENRTSADKDVFSFSVPTEGVDKYNVIVIWEDSQIYVTPVEESPDFKFKELRSGDGESFSNTDGETHIRVDATYGDNEEVDNAVWVYINNNENFGKNQDHYKTITATIKAEPGSKYEKSIKKSMNKDFKIHVDTSTGGVLYNANTTTTTTDTHIVKFTPYTAGIYNLTVALPKSLSDMQADNVVIPVRVRPTLQSIGLLIHYARKVVEDNGNVTLNCNILEDFKEVYKTVDGTIWNKDQLLLTTDEADPAEVKIWFKVTDKKSDSGTMSNPDQPLPYSLDRPATYRTPGETMLAAEGSVLDVTEETQSVPEGYTLYTNRNSLSAEDLKNKEISFIVSHNGIMSTPQTLNVNPNASVTGIEEIESADMGTEETEAIYYDLNGLKVSADNLIPGLYIKVKGNTRTKIMVE